PGLAASPPVIAVLFQLLPGLERPADILQLVHQVIVRDDSALRIPAINERPYAVLDDLVTVLANGLIAKPLEGSLPFTIVQTIVHVILIHDVDSADMCRGVTGN